MILFSTFITSFLLLIIAPFSGVWHQRRHQSDRTDMFVFFAALASVLITGTALLMQLFMN